MSLKLIGHALATGPAPVDITDISPGDVQHLRIGSIENVPVAVAFYNVPAAQVKPETTIPSLQIPVGEGPEVSTSNTIWDRGIFKSVSVFRADFGSLKAKVPVTLYKG